MSLFRLDGKLLVVDGALATDEACCECNDYDYCPPCCTRIDPDIYFTFDENGDLTTIDSVFSSLVPARVRIIMPTKFSLQVCDGEEITVVFEMTDDPPESELEQIQPHAYALWYPSWVYQSHDPGDAYFESAHGLIEWYDQKAGDSEAPERSFEVRLRYDHCWNNFPNQTLIEIGSRYINSGVQITATMCDASVDCCPIEVPCEHCCWRIDHADARYTREPTGPRSKYGGQEVYVKWSSGIRGRSKVVFLEEDLTCPKAGDEAILKTTLFLIPHRVTPDRPLFEDPTFNVTFSAENWDLDPEPAPFTITQSVGSALFNVLWEDAESLEFTVNGTINCDQEFKIPEASVEPSPFSWAAVGFGGSSFEWVQCPATDDCPCCCPKFCCGDCYLPVSRDVLDQEDPTYEVGGLSQIVGFETRLEPRGPTGACANSGSRFVQVGLSGHYLSGVNVCAPNGDLPCPRSACNFDVSIVEVFDEQDCQDQILGVGQSPQPFTIRIFVTGDGTFAISSGGVMYPYWDNSVAVGCDGGETSGATSFGTWVTSFTLQREGSGEIGFDECPEIEPGGGGDV
jgi:hypothetical protein